MSDLTPSQAMEKQRKEQECTLSAARKYIDQHPELEGARVVWSQTFFYARIEMKKMDGTWFLAAKIEPEKESAI